MYKSIIAELRSLSNPKNVEGMARFGINPKNTLGIPIPAIRKIAKEIGKDHSLAQELWESNIHEARILAALMDDPNQVTKKQMSNWVKDFDSWGVCDQVCMNLFDKTPYAYEMARKWSVRKEEYVKRAGFALIASLSVHDKSADDNVFLKFLPLIKRESTDERNFVRKAVNWALRQIGKRNLILNLAAIETSKEIQNMNSKCARWIASDALSELMSKTTSKRIKSKLLN